MLSPVNVHLYQPERRRRLGWLRLCPSWVPRVGAVEGSTLSMAVCVIGHVSVLFACVLCLCVSGICAQLHYWANLQRGKQQPHPPAWAGTLGPRVLGWAPAARREGPGRGLLEEAATSNIP